MPVPVGRERLSRAVVEEHQRDRVLAAAVGVFAGRGYQATTVDNLVEAAQIGVGSFYSLFDGKEDCFLRLYDRIVAEARERIAAAAARGSTRRRDGRRRAARAAPDRRRRARTGPGSCSSRPTPPAPPVSAATRRPSPSWPRLVRAGTARPRRRAGPPASFGDAAVAGLAWVLNQRLAAGEPVDVEELLPEMERSSSAHMKCA